MLSGRRHDPARGAIIFTILALFLGNAVLAFVSEQLDRHRAFRLELDSSIRGRGLACLNHPQHAHRHLGATTAGCAYLAAVVPAQPYGYRMNRPQPAQDAAIGTTTQAYRFALDPTPRQRRALASHCGAARVAYNWGLALVKLRLNERQSDPMARVPWSLPDLRWEWNRAKQQVAPWWAENSKEAYSSGLDGLARALKNYSDSKAGRRKGPRIGLPRPKRKGRCRDTCRFTTGPLRVEADRRHITLPRIGALKTHESTRKLARRLEQGTPLAS